MNRCMVRKIMYSSISFYRLKNIIEISFPLNKICYIKINVFKIYKYKKHIYLYLIKKIINNLVSRI